MEKKYVLAQLKQYVAGQWGEQNKELAKQFMNLTESDIVFADPTCIVGCDVEYSCTGRGCIIEEDRERYFPLTKTFRVSFELYKGDGAGVDRYYKDSGYSNILKALPYDNIVDLLEQDAYKKLNSEFAMYNAMAERLYIKINDYDCHEQTSFQCPYTPIYAMLKDSNGQNKKQLIGYIKNENDTETLEIDIEVKKLAIDGKKTMGCLFIGLGILFPPLLIGYAIYWYLKKENKI